MATSDNVRPAPPLPPSFPGDGRMDLDWEGFHRAYGPRLRGWLRKFGVPSDDLDDTLQEVWCALLVRPSQGPPVDGRNFPAWLRGLARNLVAERLRKRLRHPVGSLSGSVAEVLPGREPDPAAEFEKGLRAEAVRLALEELGRKAPERALVVLVRRGLEERPVAEVAVELGISPVQVRVVHHRMIRRIRDLLDAPSGARGDGFF